MYIEKNGYVVMDIEQMNFLDRNSEFSEDIEDVEIFEEYAIAKETSDGLNEDSKECSSSPNKYEIIKYHKTIWLDKYGLTNESTIIKCGECNCGTTCVCGEANLDCASSIKMEVNNND